MRYLLTAAMAAAVMLATGVGAKAQPPSDVDLVQNWYARYLQRSADECGLDGWVRQLRCGTSPETVEASILGSDEYLLQHGNTADGFVVGLYADVLGRGARRDEVEHWACRLRQVGCRTDLAKEFLCSARRELAGVPTAAIPPPVPLVVGRPVIVRVRYVAR